jgi:hypothetical protein
MSALRKIDALNAGHRQAWLHDLLASDTDLSHDARLLLCVLTLHHGERGVYPGLRRLGTMTGLPISRVRDARDELGRCGIISYVLGSGRRPTFYRLTSLEDWHAGRCVKPHQSCSVACETHPVSVSTVDTEPLEPLKKEGSVENVVPLVPSTGWRGVVAHAPADYRQHWLDRIQASPDGDGGIILCAPTSMHAERVRRDLEPGGVLHELALRAGVAPECVTIRAPKCGRDPYASQNVREGDVDGYDPRRSASRQIREWVDKAADRIEARTDGADIVSLASFRARQEPVTDPETFPSA